MDESNWHCNWCEIDTHCRIRYEDDGEEMDVLIRSTEYVGDPDDESVFFYGMSRQDCIDALNENKLVEGEWRIVKIHEQRRLKF